MTENEIKEYIADLRNKADILRKSGFATNGVSNHFDKSADVIEELLSYRTIGTIEEIKILKEKSVSRKIKGIRFKEAICPNCETELFETYWAFGGIHYCSNCGQKLDWQ